MTAYNILDFGAVGDSTTNNAQSIRQAIDACYANGGGRVIILAGGRYCSGTIVLRSHVNLHVERDATLCASGDPADYTVRVNVSALDNGQFDPSKPGQSMLNTAERGTNIAITGGGAIDGGGQLFIEEKGRYIHRMKSWRPFTIFLLGCTNITNHWL